MCECEEDGLEAALRDNHSSGSSEDVAKTEDTSAETKNTTIELSETPDEIIELLLSERLVFFSDAVIAISLTLLILPLLDAVQRASEENQNGDQFINIENAMLFGSFALSFFMTVMYWRSHQYLFHHVRRHTDLVRGCNNIFLFGIVLLPVTTAAVTQLGTTGSITVQAVFVGNLILVNLSLVLTNVLVRKDKRMWSPEHVPPTSLGLFMLTLNFIFLCVTMLVVCVVPNPRVLNVLFLNFFINVFVGYDNRRGGSDIVKHFGKFIDRCIGNLDK